MSFNSLKALEQAIKSKVEEVVKDDLAKEGKQKLTQAIEDTVYSNPSQYSTGEFKKSPDTEVLRSPNGIHLSVFNNPENMDAHPSWIPEKYGDNQNPWLTNWLNYGHGGLANYEGQLFIERTREELKKTAKQTLQDGLRKHGIESV